jgi:pimeloyl-ACP methyl ester carboxylesterase
VRFLDQLSSFSRHVWFDARGRGASDPLPHVEARFAEAIVDDMLALLDHLGWERVALAGDMQPQILFAAAHPKRTKALVLLNAGTRFANRPELSPTSPTALWDQMHRRWGTEAWAGRVLDLLAPSVAGDTRLRRWLGHGSRLRISPRRFDAVVVKPDPREPKPSQAGHRLFRAATPGNRIAEHGRKNDTPLRGWCRPALPWTKPADLEPRPYCSTFVS